MTFWLIFGWIIALLVATALLYFAYDLVTDGWAGLFEYGFSFFLIVCAIGAVALMYSIHEEQTSPILATLHKGYWTCTDTVTRQQVTYIQSGQVSVPVFNEVTTCVQYTRR